MREVVHTLIVLLLSLAFTLLIFALVIAFAYFVRYIHRKYSDKEDTEDDAEDDTEEEPQMEGTGKIVVQKIPGDCGEEDDMDFETAMNILHITKCDMLGRCDILGYTRDPSYTPSREEIGRAIETLEAYLEAHTNREE